MQMSDLLSLQFIVSSVSDPLSACIYYRQFLAILSALIFYVSLRTNTGFLF